MEGFAEAQIFRLRGMNGMAEKRLRVLHPKKHSVRFALEKRTVDTSGSAVTTIDGDIHSPKHFLSLMRSPEN
jgi:hypothetical protein